MNVNELAPLDHGFARAALILHAEFQKDSTRCWITFKVAGENAVQLDIFESVPHDLTGGFGGVSVAPEGNANPVTEFGPLMLYLRM